MKDLRRSFRINAGDSSHPKGIDLQRGIDIEVMPVPEAVEGLVEQ